MAVDNDSRSEVQFQCRALSFRQLINFRTAVQVWKLRLSFCYEKGQAG